MNQLLRGWAAYFNQGTCSMAYRAVDNSVRDQVHYFLWRRHKVRTRHTRRIPAARILGELGILRLRKLHVETPARSSS